MLLHSNKCHHNLSINSAYRARTTLVDLDNKDQYDNNGFISQSVSKEEREQNIQTPILGNVKVFYTDNQSQPASTPAQASQNFQDDDMEKLPF